MSQATGKPTAIVTYAIEPVLPGSYAVLTAGDGDDTTCLFAIPMADTASRFPGDGALKAAGNAIPLPVVHRREECFTVDMPMHVPAVFALQSSPALDVQTAWFSNRPRLNWSYPERATAGGELRLLGRNLVRFDQYVCTDPATPASQGNLIEVGLKPSPDGSRCVMRRQGDQPFMAVPVRAASSYEAYLELPGTLPAGNYEVYFHNGLGGAAGWSEALVVTVGQMAAWPERVFTLDVYIAQTGSVDDAFTAALKDVEQHGGGTLALGPRTYELRRTVVMPARTRLQGAGADRTLLHLPHHTAAGQEGPYVAITGDGDFTVEDLAIRGVYAPLLICAPTFLPATQDEAAGDWPRVGLSDRRAHNVTIRRCRLEQFPFHHSMRRKDFDQRGWMKAFGDRGWAAIRDGEPGYSATRGSDHYACIALKGDGLVVEDCTVLGGGHAVDLNRSSYVRISGNVLRAGHFGMGLHAFTRLTWPADGGGAKIEGNEMRRVIVENNDVSARSEFARNLISFNFGGDELFIARNHIHGMSPNCDSEALMTHLWTARWCKPRVRMTSPLTAEILDVSGEVTKECLDGAWLDVLQGRGMGQVRRIVRREGMRIWFDRPWRVAPDEASIVAFTAPSLFRHLTMVNNRIETQAINIIVWGSSYDTVIDGNYVADGPGITIWSVRLAGDQKVWGGAAYTLVCNNIMDRGYSSPANENAALDGAMGFFIRCGRAHDCAKVGYDILGLIVRHNHSTNNCGIGIRTTFQESGPGKARKPWEIRYAGIVLENNLCTDSVVGIAVEKDAEVAIRNNACRNVDFPLSRGKVPCNFNE